MGSMRLAISAGEGSLCAAGIRTFLIETAVSPDEMRENLFTLVFCGVRWLYEKTTIYHSLVLTFGVMDR
jgi:hypothetical protein